MMGWAQGSYLNDMASVLTFQNVSSCEMRFRAILYVRTTFLAEQYLRFYLKSFWKVLVWVFFLLIEKTD